MYVQLFFLFYLLEYFFWKLDDIIFSHEKASELKSELPAAFMDQIIVKSFTEQDKTGAKSPFKDAKIESELAHTQVLRIYIPWLRKY